MDPHLSPAVPPLPSLSQGSCQSAYESVGQSALAPVLYGVVLYVSVCLSLSVIVLKLMLCVPVVFFFFLLFIASGCTLGVYVLFKKLLNGFPHWLLCWAVY